MSLCELIKVVSDSDIDIYFKKEICEYLYRLYEADDSPRQEVHRGDIVRLKYGNENVFTVLKAFWIENARMFIVYNHLEKDVCILNDKLLSDPEKVAIVGHIDPKMIFKEDIKCV